MSTEITFSIADKLYGFLHDLKEYQVQGPGKAKEEGGKREGRRGREEGGKKKEGRGREEGGKGREGRKDKEER